MWNLKKIKSKKFRDFKIKNKKCGNFQIFKIKRLEQKSNCTSISSSSFTLLSVSDNESCLCYIYPNRPLPFDFLHAFPTYSWCYSRGTFCRNFSSFSDRLREPIVEDTDERDLRAVGLKLTILLFRVAALLTQPCEFYFSLSVYSSFSFFVFESQLETVDDDRPLRR